MPSPETSDLPHRAILWPIAGTDDNGETTVSDPVEIPVRWVPKRSTTTDAQGNVIGTDVTVAVEREVEVGSIMWRGGFDDIPGTADAPPGNFYEVVTYDEADDLKGRETARQVKLIRYSNTLPAVV